MGAIIYDKCHKLTISIFYYHRGYRFAPVQIMPLWLRRQRKHLAECNKCKQIVTLLEYYRERKDLLGESAMALCPVCGQTKLDDYDICKVCGWEEDSLARLRPNLCEGGPNYVPLSWMRSRWKEGIRDRIELCRCPFNEECTGCKYSAYP